MYLEKSGVKILCNQSADTTEIIFVKILISYTIGIILLYDTINQSVYHITCFLFTAIFLSLIIINIFYRALHVYRFKWLPGMLFYILIMLFGALSVIHHSDKYFKDHFSNHTSKYLKLIIIDEPQSKNQILRFKADVTLIYTEINHAINPEKPLKQKPKSEVRTLKTIGKLMISIKIDPINPIQLKYGDELIIPNNIKTIAAPFNPSEFDYRFWMAAQNVYHQTFLQQNQVIKLNHRTVNAMIAFAINIRAEQVKFYKKIIKRDDAFAIAATLILGYRSDLSAETLSIYSRTGTIHALSVSGMHVGLIYLVLNLTLQFMDRYKYLKVIKIILTLVLIWFYTLITGLSPSVLRSAIMISVFIMAKSFSKKTNSYNIIAFTACALLVYNPFLIWDVGFQLSFLAVLGLIFLQPKIQNCWYIKNKWLNKLWGIVAMSLAAQFITYPLSIYYFHQFPIYFLISNLFITLPIAILMYLGIFILITKFEFLGQPFEWLINFTNSGLSWIADLPFSSLSGIWINKIELFLVTVTLTLIVFALIHLNKKLMFGAFIIFILLQCDMSYKKFQNEKQRKIICFNLEKNYAVAFISARKCFVLTDLHPENKVFKYFVQPALDQHKISETVCITGAKDISTVHFQLKGDDIAFYNYRINKNSIINYRLRKNKAIQLNLN